MKIHTVIDLDTRRGWTEAPSVEPGYLVSPLVVMESAAGCYLGHVGWSPEFGGHFEPYDRQTHYMDRATATRHLQSELQDEIAADYDDGVETGNFSRPGVELGPNDPPSRELWDFTADWYDDNGYTVTVQMRLKQVDQESAA